MKLSNVLVLYMREKSAEKTVKTVAGILKKKHMSCKCIERNQIKQSDFKGRDFVIAVGGDGTFLRASHYIKDSTPLLGINSNTRTKEGFFMQANKVNFWKNLRRILAGHFKILKLPRIQAFIGREKIDLALNEIYVGAPKPYTMARYSLKVGKNREIHRSSGLLVSTPAGSYSWMKSAGGKTQSFRSKRLQYLVREPYSGRIFNPKIFHGFISGNEKIIVKAMMDLVVVADSLSKEYFLPKGKEVVIGISKKPLSYVLLC